MRTHKYKTLTAILLAAIAIGSCTKLKEGYRQTTTNALASNLFPASLALQNAYNDIPAPFVNQDRVFSLEENSSDESLVPTRGGDWDDNGVWRVVHNHTWNADH